MSNHIKTFINIEKKYLDKLDLIDSKISTCWMKQFNSISPNISELLKCVQDIISIHKLLYNKLTNVQDIVNLNEIFLNLINDTKMGMIYKLYLKNLNQKDIILCIPSIKKILKDSMTIESLFYSPLNQIQFYKLFFNKLNLNSNIILNLNNLFNTIITDNMNFNFKLSNIIIYDIFQNSQHSSVHFILTASHLIFFTKEDNTNHLLYPPIKCTQSINIKLATLDSIQFNADGLQLTFDFIQKQQFNIWLDLLTTDEMPLSQVVHKLENTMSTHDPSLNKSLSSNSLNQKLSKKPSFAKSIISAVTNRSSLKKQHLSSINTNHSTPSLNHSQTSLNLTPPLSRSSSSHSLTPTNIIRSQSIEDLSTPPESPELIQCNNIIKNILYTNNHFKVFHWKNDSWYAVDEDCILQVSQILSGKSCISIYTDVNQLYLNTWFSSDTLIHRTNDTDLCLTIKLNNIPETYLFHFDSKLESDRFNTILNQIPKDSVNITPLIRSSSLSVNNNPTPQELTYNIPLVRSSSLSANNTLTPQELANTFKLAMQCKCKLYVQSSSSKWNSFGSVSMKISQQYNTKKMHIDIESFKQNKKLVSAMVFSNNVERLNSKKVSFMLIDDHNQTNVVYMIQVREELTADKIVEYIKTRNAENGW